MKIMDTYAYELLACPTPPGYLFAADGAVNPEITAEQLEVYLRGVLPPPPSAADVVPPTPPGCTTADTAPWGCMDYAMELPVEYAAELPIPAKFELYAAAFDAHVRPAAAAAVEVPDFQLPETPYDAENDASLRATEKDPRERPSPEYLGTTQRGRMDPMARANLVLWISEFAHHYSLGRAVLHRAVLYADRFLSARPLAGDCASYGQQLRLLGAAAAFAAAKYEDRAAASKLNARGIASHCGFAASREVTDTERAMMAALDYRLGGPTVSTFVDHFTRHGAGDLELLRHTAHGMADSSLFDHRCLKLRPSAVAASAILLAMVVLNPSYGEEQVRRWSKEIEELTGYRPVELKDGMDAMRALMLDCYSPFEISPLFFVEDL
ncbi:hypothetical protein ACP4OV_006322 [Aristida adscensionis]